MKLTFYSIILKNVLMITQNGCPLPPRIGSVVVAFIISGIILKFIGGEPLQSLKFFFEATFGSWASLLRYDGQSHAADHGWIGLCRCLQNEIVEYRRRRAILHGRFFCQPGGPGPVGSPGTTPKVIVIGLMIIMGMFGGAIWGFFPGYLKARFKVNEIITTLMLNYIAIFWNNFWIFDKWSDAGFQMTPQFEKVAWLPATLARNLAQRIIPWLIFGDDPASGRGLWSWLLPLSCGGFWNAAAGATKSNSSAIIPKRRAMPV